MRRIIGWTVLGMGAAVLSVGTALFRTNPSPTVTHSVEAPTLTLPEVHISADFEDTSEAAHDAPELEPFDGGEDGCIAEACGPERAAPTPVPLHPVLGHTTNVLLLGLDRHPGVRRGGLADTLIIAALDSRKRRLGLVSVPRDLYVTVENHGETRLNAVYALARKDKIPPTEAFDRVLRDTLGVPIHHTIAIDLGLFERAIDTVGGIEVDVPCPIRDRFIDSRVEGGRRELDVAAGRQHMDGATAAMYVRSRHGRSDWSRARRQQAVMVALRNKLTDPSLLLQVPELIHEWNDAVTTDLGPLALFSLVRQALQVDVQNLHGVVLGHKETIGKRTANNWSVLEPNHDAIAARLDDVYGAPLPGLEEHACPDADVALRRRAKPLPTTASSPAASPSAVSPPAISPPAALPPAVLPPAAASPAVP